MSSHSCDGFSKDNFSMGSQTNGFEIANRSAPDSKTILKREMCTRLPWNRAPVLSNVV
jgi:hypothetical protein